MEHAWVDEDAAAEKKKSRTMHGICSLEVVADTFDCRGAKETHRTEQDSKVYGFKQALTCSQMIE